MAFLTKVGSFAINNVIGNQTISGVGFRPKAVLLLPGPLDLTSPGIAVDMWLGMGVAVGFLDFAVTANSEDAQGASDTHRESINNREALWTLPGSQSDRERLQSQNVHDDGFIVEVEIGGHGGTVVGYIAFGGDDLESVTAASVTGATAVGNQSVTGVGFQPDALILAGVHTTGFPGHEEGNVFFLGFAKSPTEQAAMCVASQNAVGTTNSERVLKTDKCLIQLNDTATRAVRAEAELVSFDADGYTLNYTTAPGSDGKQYFYLALKGNFNSAVGSLNTLTSAGGLVETGLGFEPQAGIFGSVCNPSSSSVEDGLESSIGFAESSADRFVAGGSDENGQGTSDCDSFYSPSLIYQNYDFAQVQEGAIDFVSWDFDGFTLNQTDADPNSNEIMYMVFGSIPVPPVPPVPVTISDQRPALAIPGLAEYKVRIKNQDGEAVAEFDNWLSLSFTHKVNNRGTIRFEINGEDDRVEYLTPDSNNLDNQIEVWRRNPIVGLDWYIEWEGFLRTNNDLFEQNDNNKLVAFGFSYLDLARRAEIKWDATTTQADKSGVGETVMKEYVSENIGVGALAASGRAADNVMPGLSIQADLGAGLSWAGAMSGRGLLDTLQGIAVATGVDFDIIGTGAALFQFVTYDGQRNDRTKDNADGNAPVIFSLGFGNMIVPVLSKNRSAEVTAAYALGKGTDTARQEAVTESLAALDSPWNRIEKTTSASNTAGDDLDSAADELLEKSSEDIKFTFQVLQTIATYYGLHYWWGDLVTAQFKAENFDKKLTEAQVNVSPNSQGERISIKFSDR